MLPTTRALFAVAILGTGCATSIRRSVPTATPPGSQWIWDVLQRRVIDQPTLLRKLESRRLVLVGERHDHPLHHQIQAAILEGLLRAGRRPAVVFEMVTPDQGAVLARPPVDPVELGRALRWEARGWPSWTLYQPIAALALRAGLALVAGGLSQMQLFRLLHRGEKPSPPPLGRAQTHDTRFSWFPGRARAGLREEIRRGHCGHGGPRLLEIMTRLQLLKDAEMAAALARQHARDGALLIAGNGHARADHGVPLHLAQAGLGPQTASVGLLERDGDPGELVRRFRAEPPPYDFVWVTPYHDRTDPCQKYRKQLQRLHHR